MESTAATAPSRLAVQVIYNGVPQGLAYEPHERARALFEQACNAFGIPAGEREQLALYQPDNTTEVPLDSSVEEAGVKPDTTLILRPREAGGG
jgi:hypothetical protein